MTFWSCRVKSKEPYVHDFNEDPCRIHITRACLAKSVPKRVSIVRCRSDVFDPAGASAIICRLIPGQKESCHMDLVLEDSVTFSVSGPAVYFSGYRYELDDEEDYDDDDSDDSDFITHDEEDDDEEYPVASSVKIEEIENEEANKDDEEEDDDDYDSDEDGLTLTKKKRKVLQPTDGPPKKKAADNASAATAAAAAATATAVDAAVTPTEGKAKKKAKKANAAVTPEDKENNVTGVTGTEKGTGSKPTSQKKAAKKVSRKFPNGLEIEETGMGKPDGKQAKPGQKVAINYIGKLKSNGKIFDSTVGKRAFEFRLGTNEAIKGFDVGINGMRIGDKRRVTIPPEMGYGAGGVKGTIPGNAWLVFDVELINVK